MKVGALRGGGWHESRGVESRRCRTEVLGKKYREVESGGTGFCGCWVGGLREVAVEQLAGGGSQGSKVEDEKGEVKKEGGKSEVVGGERAVGRKRSVVV